jgi:hypothetical protein
MCSDKKSVPHLKRWGNVWAFSQGGQGPERQAEAEQGTGHQDGMGSTAHGADAPDGEPRRRLAIPLRWRPRWRDHAVAHQPADEARHDDAPRPHVHGPPDPVGQVQ